MRQSGRDKDTINRGSRYMDLSFENHLAVLPLLNAIVDSPICIIHS